MPDNFKEVFSHTRDRFNLLWLLADSSLIENMRIAKWRFETIIERALLRKLLLYFLKELILFKWKFLKVIKNLFPALSNKKIEICTLLNHHTCSHKFFLCYFKPAVYKQQNKIKACKFHPKKLHSLRERTKN